MDIAVATTTRSQQAKTVCKARRNKGQGIAIDPLDVAYQIGRENMLNIKVVTWSLAIWTTCTFLFCIVFAILTPASLYMHALLLQVLPGFEWFSWRGFLVGLIESFLYGAYAGLVYVPIYNFLHRKWVRQQP